MDWIVGSLTVIIHALSGSITTPLNKFHIYLRCIAQSVTFLAIFIALLTVHCSDLKNMRHFSRLSRVKPLSVWPTCPCDVRMWCGTLSHISWKFAAWKLFVCTQLWSAVDSPALCAVLYIRTDGDAVFLCMVLVLLLIHSPLNRSLGSHENIHKWRNLREFDTIKHLRVC